MQPSTPATPSLLQTFVLRYSSHPSFASLLQKRETRRALHALQRGLQGWAEELQALSARSECALHGEFSCRNLLLARKEVEGEEGAVPRRRSRRCACLPHP